MVNIDKNELAKTGIQFGSLARRWNPQMRSFIYNKNSKVHILDLQKIISSCEKVGKYLKSIVEKRETILFLSTKKQASEIVKEQAIKCGMPYIVNKWKGGFLTNFEVIKVKLRELQGLNNFFQKDTFKNLIKKEQATLEKKRNKLQNIYEGEINLRKRPGALFIIGLNKEKTALREAKKIGIPIIAVCNTNCDPRLVDYVIPGNDDSIRPISFFANLVADAIIESKKEKVPEDGSDNRENKIDIQK
jgi:small subunit ribosomal protein S2